tara:strand:- start:8613 stop:8867 length:255 start_codon:yes stop_codon:yes gene_type:complete
MGMHVQLPVIKERINWGNDIIGFIILDIETQMENYISQQREIRFLINPLKLEISHHYKNCIRFGFSIFRYGFAYEIKYGKLEKL